MDIEKIEKLVSNLVASLEQETETISPAYGLPIVQLQLLLHIYKRLESIDDTLASMDRDSWERHHP